MMHVPPLMVPMHAKPQPRLGYTSLPKGIDWAKSPLHRIHDAFEPSPHVGTQRIQEALHHAVERAEAGVLRVALRCAWWWVRRKLAGSAHIHR